MQSSDGRTARVERGRCSEDGAARAEQRSACGRRLGGEPDLARGDAGGEQLLASLCPRVDGVAVHQREHARQLLDPRVQVVALARHCGEQEREGDGRVPRLPERLAQLLVLVKDLPTPCRVPDMSTTRPRLERSGLQRGGVVAGEDAHLVPERRGSEAWGGASESERRPGRGRVARIELNARSSGSSRTLPHMCSKSSRACRRWRGRVCGRIRARAVKSRAGLWHGARLAKGADQLVVRPVVWPPGGQAPAVESRLQWRAPAVWPPLRLAHALFIPAKSRGKSRQISANLASPSCACPSTAASQPATKRRPASGSREQARAQVGAWPEPASP